MRVQEEWKRRKTRGRKQGGWEAVTRNKSENNIYIMKTEDVVLQAAENVNFILI